jgi:hypothetical protein
MSRWLLLLPDDEREPLPASILRTYAMAESLAILPHWTLLWHDESGNPIERTRRDSNPQPSDP